MIKNIVSAVLIVFAFSFCKAQLAPVSNAVYNGNSSVINSSSSKINDSQNNYDDRSNKPITGQLKNYNSQSKQGVHIKSRISVRFQTYVRFFKVIFGME